VPLDATPESLNATAHTLAFFADNAEKKFSGKDEF